MWNPTAAVKDANSLEATRNELGGTLVRQTVVS